MFLRASRQAAGLYDKVLSSRIKIATASMATAPKFKVEHDHKNQQFVIPLKDETGNEDKAVLQYQWVRKGVVDMYHTGVPPEFRKQGIAQVLAKAAFDYVVETDGKMRLSCTYLQKYIKDNPLPEYESRVLPLD